MDVRTHRRKFLEFLAGSPLLALAQQEAAPIRSPAEALSVTDFEAAARKALPPAHFGYLATGVDDDATVRANLEAFRHVELRARRLVDVSRTETALELFGARWQYPLGLAPLGNMKAFHPDADLAVARAAQAKQTQLVHSTFSTTRIEDVAQAAGRPLWFQLYATPSWAVTERLVRRAEAAGCAVLALTVDLPAGRNAETASRYKKLDPRPCATCHGSSPEAKFQRKPLFDGIDMKGIPLYHDTADWAFLGRLRKLTSMKLVLKGIGTREDAALAVEHGVDGIIVSNHGGRAEDSGRASLECLPEVVEEAGNLMPVMFDGGIRRGTDILKALALGARAVFIGRPFAWGVAAFGQAGVERVLDILHAEFVMAMKQCGVRTLAEITPATVAVKF
jgi:isopentenyl diphosphate isomerase/L-lactate dehydrogenase-like FMN-dependent dehydrogenase